MLNRFGQLADTLHIQIQHSSTTQGRCGLPAYKFHCHVSCTRIVGGRSQSGIARMAGSAFTEPPDQGGSRRAQPGCIQQHLEPSIARVRLAVILQKVIYILFSDDRCDRVYICISWLLFFIRQFNLQHVVLEIVKVTRAICMTWCCNWTGGQTVILG